MWLCADLTWLLNGVLTGSTYAVQALYILVMRSLMTSNHGHVIELLGNVDDWEAYIKQLASNFVAK